MTRGDVLARVDGLRSGRTPFVLATVVRAERPTSARPGDCALVLPDGTIEGFVGGACAESTVRLEGLRLLRAGESTLLRITPSDSDSDAAGGPSESASESTEGLVTAHNPCLSGGTLEIFLEAMVPPTVVGVFGHAPIARALARLGAALDYDVRESDDPAAGVPADATAVVVASHGREEERVLEAALRAGVPYVGLVASRRRGAAVLAALDVDDEARVRVHTPAGLDIGAATPPEVALAVFADIVARRPARPSPGPSGPSGPDAPEHSGPGAPDPEVEAAVDPVCGMTVAVVAEALSVAGSVAGAGSTRYFCGPGCRQAFLDAPTRFGA